MLAGLKCFLPYSKGVGGFLVIDLSTCPIPLKEAPFPATLVIVVSVPGLSDMIKLLQRLVQSQQQGSNEHNPLPNDQPLHHLDTVRKRRRPLLVLVVQ